MGTTCRCDWSASWNRTNYSGKFTCGEVLADVSTSQNWFGVIPILLRLVEKGNNQKLVSDWGMVEFVSVVCA